MGKRGRKPSPNSSKNYFGDVQEQAVLSYLSTDDKYEKELIYMDTLKPAFEKMIESIIRRYHLYIPNEESGDTFNDTLSFLMSKMERYEESKSTKAYSYYGTICKNHLIERIQKMHKEWERNESYDAFETLKDELSNDIRYSNKVDKNALIAKETLDKLSKKITLMIEEPENFSLKESEIKLGKALLILFENWDYVLSTDYSNKLNKSSILFFLKETTGLTSKGIRDNMKKFKKEFLLIKHDVIN